MNAAKIAAALNTISVAFGELAEALIEQPGTPRPAESVAARVPSAPADLPPSLDDLPPEEWVEAPAPVAASPLGQCPVHHVAWTIKPAGTSKAGKPYGAFWKCAERDGDEYCDKKPTRAWQDSHKIPAAA